MRITIEQKIDIAKKYMIGRGWCSPTQIGAQINGGHSSVGTPVCKKMVDLGLAERNNKGHYRLTGDNEKLTGRVPES